MNVLSDEAIKVRAPSVFTLGKAPERSERYTQVRTIELVTALRKAGYAPTAAMESRVRKHNEDRRAYVKHMVRLRHKQYIELAKVGDTVPEILIINSHNGSSAFCINAGLFRMVCANGMVIADEKFGSLYIRHDTQDIIAEVLSATKQIADHMPKVMEAIDTWDKIIMPERARQSMARKAIAFRYGGNSPITAQQALLPRRNEDEGNSLWRTFNVLQENLTKGGLEGKSSNGRKIATRAINSVHNDIVYNRGLWQIGSEFAEKLA